MEQTGQKRVFVSNDDPDVEIHVAKRPKIELNTGTKTSCLKALCATYIVLQTQYNLKVEDIYGSCQLANIIRSCYNIARQQALGLSEFKKKHESKEFTLIKDGNSIIVKRAETIATVKKVFEWCGLKFTKPDAKD